MTVVLVVLIVLLAVGAVLLVRGRRSAAAGRGEPAIPATTSPEAGAPAAEDAHDTQRFRRNGHGSLPASQEGAGAERP